MKKSRKILVASLHLNHWSMILVSVLATTTFANASGRHEEARFSWHGKEFKLRVTVSEVTEPNTFENVKVEYTIHKDGRFMHRADQSGGVTWGCINGGKALPLPKDILRPLLIGTQQVGWMFDLFAACGNAASKHLHMIVISDEKDRDAYNSKDFIGKVSPIIAAAPDGQSATVWSVYQEWGDGATVESFFVPRGFRVALNAPHQVFAEERLPSDVTKWPRFAGLPYTKPSYVVAAINQLEGAPIRAVLGDLSKKDAEHLQSVGLPSTKEALGQLADHLDAAGRTIKKFYRPWFDAQ